MAKPKAILSTSPRNNSNFQESPIKHTSGGEMPNTSQVSELTEQFRAAVPVLSESFRNPGVLVPILATGLSIGGYFLWKKFKKEE